LSKNFRIFRNFWRVHADKGGGGQFCADVFYDGPFAFLVPQQPKRSRHYINCKLSAFFVRSWVGEWWV